MREFNLQNEVNNLLESLDDVDFSNVKSILGWFYKGIDYNSMYENLEIAKYVYFKLKENGYRAMVNPEEELKTFNALINSKGKVDPGILGKSIISQIMESIRKCRSFNTSLTYLIEMYNQLYNKEYACSIMMNSLKNNIGNEILYVAFNEGVRILRTGTLLNVEPYKSITVTDPESSPGYGGIRIPFVGFRTAITSIHSSSGMCLYSNSLIEEGYNIQDFKKIEKLNMDTFGENYNNTIKRGFM